MPESTVGIFRNVNGRVEMTRLLYRLMNAFEDEFLVMSELVTAVRVERFRR